MTVLKKCQKFLPCSPLISWGLGINNRRTSGYIYVCLYYKHIVFISMKPTSGDLRPRA